MKLLEVIEDCCRPLLREPLDARGAEQVAAAFKVLGDPARLRLLIAATPHGEACVCELIEPLGLSQPTVSHHLRLLYEAGLLDRERRGTWVYYRVVPERVETLRAVLSA
jgi:ArsR family transcriptional regulator, arsenate/arsenite/antimonite-responsive transcriptional repressor